MIKEFKDSFAQNQPISWPLYIFFGYILLPMACSLSLMLMLRLFGNMRFNQFSWDMVLCSVIGSTIGICISSIILLDKRRKANKETIISILSDLNIECSKKYKFWFECPACGKVWDPDIAPANNLCPIDFIPLKKIDPVERDQFEDL
ncbi:MAG: hypothetical protein ACNFW9_05400 [Candidatus Kerfeldbacteria bacterium]|jgi:hypothetical protein